MQVLYPTYPGLLAICDGCGCLLRYTLSDIYGKIIYCPQCKTPTEVSLEREYDGIVKENE